MRTSVQINKGWWIPLVLLGLFSCTPELSDTGFFDEEDILFSISAYIEENQEEFSGFWKIIETTNSYDALNAYNPEGEGFTFFLPTDDAIDNYISRSPNYSTLEDLLADPSFCMNLTRYHLVNKAIRSTEFPYGVLPDSTVSGDYLTMGIEVTEDTTIYRVNNVAAISLKNIETSNGYIHVIDQMLEPIVFSSYDWLASNPQFTILSSLFEMTGLKDTMGIYRNTENGTLIKNTYTILAEPDSIYHKAGIQNLEDLELLYGTPGKAVDDPQNGLYQFAAYHILEGTYFLDGIVGSRNYNTYALAPVAMNSGYDIIINAGVDTFQTIYSAADTTYIDYILPFYNHSNINTKNGAIHAIDQVMEFFVPEVSSIWFQFYQEHEINEIRYTAGTYEFVDKDLFQYLDWEGPDEIIWYKSTSTELKASNQDYLEIDGDFVLDYVIPKVLPGTYEFQLRVEATSAQNSTIEIFLDGNKIGSNYNLTSGGTATNPYYTIKPGIVEFIKYEEHTIRIQSLIPGVLNWDWVGFIIN